MQPVNLKQEESQGWGWVDPAEGGSWTRAVAVGRDTIFTKRWNIAWFWKSVNFLDCFSYIDKLSASEVASSSLEQICH